MKQKALTRTLFALLAIASLTICACTVHYVADYDASMKEEVVEVAKEVDQFWGALLDTDASSRKYEFYKKEYNEIETDIRGLVLRNEIRPMNKETTRQAQIALELWCEDRRIHKKNDTFSDFEAKSHRKQYLRVFTAMAKGEEAKNISTPNVSVSPKGETK